MRIAKLLPTLLALAALLALAGAAAASPHAPQPANLYPAVATAAAPAAGPAAPAAGAAPQKPLFVDVTCSVDSFQCVLCAHGVQQCSHYTCTDNSTFVTCGSCLSSCAE